VRIGVLALQGDFALHRAALERARVEAVEVRKPDQLARVDGLIIPGGESTTLLKLMEAWDFVPALEKFHGAGKPLFGTCAGLILLARDVTNPKQWSLGLLDVGVERNAYGRQRESFATQGQARLPDGTRHLEMVFIRAPRIIRLGSGVRTLAELRGEPVMVQQGAVLAATFHPELTADASVHRYFCQLVESSQEELA
jgi:5'-phosphate synthase pdxT subunit